MRSTLLTTLISFVIFIGCSQPKEYIFQPLDNISFAFEVHNLKYRPDTTSVFVYYELTVTNNATNEINFNPDDIKMRINGLENKYTYYDSLGSVMTESQAYSTGSAVFDLYSVFSKELKGLKLRDIQTVTLESSGLEDSP